MAFYVLFIVLYKYALYIGWEVSCRLSIFLRCHIRLLYSWRIRFVKKSFQSLFMYLSYYMLRAGIGTGCGWLKINVLLYVWKMKKV